jgi:hypothetical protein
MLNLQVEWFRLNKNQALGAPTQEIKNKRLRNIELIKALRARQKGETVPEPEPLLEESATHRFLSSHSDAAASAGGVGRPLPPEIAGDDLGDDGDNDDADVDAAVNGQVRDDPETHGSMMYLSQHVPRSQIPAVRMPKDFAVGAGGNGAGNFGIHRPDSYPGGPTRRIGV